MLDLTNRYIDEYGLTAMMITHNMADAIAMGNRLLMLDEGKILLDVRGEDKKKLTVEALVDIFHQVKKQDYANDKSLLS